MSVFLFVGPGFPFLTVPLSVGVSGTTVIATTNPIVGVQNVTATFLPWTPGSGTISSLFGTTTTPNGATNMTVALPNFTFMGSFNLTAGGAGSVRLVSPTVTAVCVGGYPTCDGSTWSYRTAGATSLTLNFSVPEPGPFLLLGAGLAALAAVGRGPRS